ncbi:ABC transporter permease [Kiloniella sp. b19]|uniref:ABC transporter permease n=1 Tax=Kiloniella sp. GXU_MW_B19 TaxID=3141326 RepID=UPI0031D48F8A
MDDTTVSPLLPSIETGSDQDIRLSGTWITQHVPTLEKCIGQWLSRKTAPGNLIVDFSAVQRMDTAGALLFLRMEKHLLEQGFSLERNGVSPAAASILKAVEPHAQISPGLSPRLPLWERILNRAAAIALEFLSSLRDLTAFTGLITQTLIMALLNPRRLRFNAILTQVQKTGASALPIVGLISFLIGIVLAFQGAGQLRNFGAEIFTVNLVAIGVLREMGILLTAIVVAGRSGSAFTAEIGTMKVSEEIDAMQTIGLNPIEVLALPRIIGLLIALPLLTFYADMMGLLGGAMISFATLGITPLQFIETLHGAAGLNDFFVGIIKAPVFAFIIAMVGCHEGFKVSRSAESVGQQTTRAVVESIFIVIVLDALLSILFSALGI